MGLFSILPALSILLVASFLAEQRMVPRPQPLDKRPPRAWMMHLGLVVLFYGVVLLIFQRPWFAAATGLALVFLLLLVNNVKMSSLREPFFHQDFEYFWDLLRHPRLYLPFFGLIRTLAASLFALILMGAGLYLEPTLSGWAPSLILPLALVLIGAALCWFGGRRVGELALSLNPYQDMYQQGFFSLLGFYVALQWQTRPRSDLQCPQVESTLQHDFVVVQSESFFDPRKVYSFVRTEVLSAFDSICKESTISGSLKVPVWGANTVRTEFAFLSGLHPDALGIRKFNPYHWLANHKLNTSVEQMKTLGYHTVCIHPYPASFYRRDEVFPNLGFETFIDIDAFDPADRVGQYIGDQAVGNKLFELLEHRDSRPLFVFVITMENHGPLHLEKPDPGRAKELYYDGKAPARAEDLTVYLQHLQNADALIQRLRSYLAGHQRPTTLCWYGDHVPIMEKVYEDYGPPQGETEFFIWQSHPSRCRAQLRDLEVQDLLQQMISVASPLQPVDKDSAPN